MLCLERKNKKAYHVKIPDYKSTQNRVKEIAHPLEFAHDNGFILELGKPLS